MCGIDRRSDVSMSAHQYILGLVIYVFVVTGLVAMIATGMNMGTVQTININVEQPDTFSESSDIPIIGGLIDTLGDIGAGAMFVGSFLSTFMTVLVWTLPELIFPLWANIIFIKAPLIALIYIIVEMLLP